MIKLVLVCLLAIFSLSAQNVSETMPVGPDCSITFRLTAAGDFSTVHDNRRVSCHYWTVSYTVQGFSALSLVVQNAAESSTVPDTPGTFGTVSPSVGVNPNTSTSGTSSSFAGAAAYWRVSLASKTGTGKVIGRLYGWRMRAGQVPGASPTTTILGSPCTGQAIISASTTGNTEIIAASPGTTIRVCNISWASASPIDVKLVQGTGLNCVTGPADVTGLYKNVAAFAQDFWGSMVLAPDQALCLNISGNVATGGFVSYAQN